MRFFADQHEKNRQTLRDIQTLAQEISQQQDRLRQMQRLSEEQMRRELREWQNENQRKWAQEAERLERANLRQGDLDTAQNARLETLEKHHEDTVVRFGLGEERVKELRTDIGRVRDRMETIYRGIWRTLQKSTVGLLGELREVLGLED
jgi:hypothetical protein